jgi:hypothetical protein
LRAVMIVVDRLVSDGVPLAVGPNSRMNKALHKWLNDKASRSHDIRKSRRREITPSAVRALLKQIRNEGRPIARGKAPVKKSIQDVARELLRQLRARSISDAD